MQITHLYIYELTSPPVYADYVSKLQITSVKITKDITGRIGNLQIALNVAMADVVFTVGSAIILAGNPNPSDFGSEWGTSDWGDPEWGAGATVSDTTLFNGTITKLEPTALTISAGGTGFTVLNITATDYSAALDRAVIIGAPFFGGFALSYSGVADATILYDCIVNARANGTLDLGIAWNLDTVAGSISITLNNGMSLRQVFEAVIGQVGDANFWVDENKVIQYHGPTAYPAPFNIGDTEDNFSIPPVYLPEYSGISYLSDGSNLANLVKVFGASSGASAFDAVSIAKYGTKAQTVIDGTLNSPAAVAARASSIVEQYANPIPSGRFVIRKDGLSVGQYLNINLPSLGIVATNMLIFRVETTWDVFDRVKYVVSFGGFGPDLVKYIRLLSSKVQQVAATVLIPSQTTGYGYSGSTITPDLVTGPFQYYSLTGNATIANPANPDSISGLWVLVIDQDATGGRTITLGSSYFCDVSQLSTAALTRTTILFLAVPGGNSIACGVWTGAQIPGQAAPAAGTAGYGVTKLVAGTNVTLTPSSGVGKVKIDASNSGGVTSLNSETGALTLTSGTLPISSVGTNISIDGINAVNNGGGLTIVTASGSVTITNSGLLGVTSSANGFILTVAAGIVTVNIDAWVDIPTLLSPSVGSGFSYSSIGYLNTNAGAYQQIGKRVTVQFELSVVVSAGGNQGSFSFAFPVAPKTGIYQTLSASLSDNTASPNSTQCPIISIYGNVCTVVADWITGHTYWLRIAGEYRAQ